MTTEKVDIWQQGTVAGEEKQITDEAIAGARERIGIELVELTPFNEFATKDAIRHFVQGVGDINPLWRDEEYASKTRWKEIIAPPTFHRTMGVSQKKSFTPEERRLGRSGLQGIHNWGSGTAVEQFQPIYLNDRLTIKSYLDDVVEKRSQFAGRMAISYTKHIYTNSRGELVKISRTQGHQGGRQKQWGERQKYADLTRPVYTSGDIARIDAAYEREEIRGSTPRYWEDVNVGDELVPLVKGPLTITSLFNFKVGEGMAFYEGAFRYSYENRKRHPLFYAVNSHGVPDEIERVHWEDEYAQKTGNPMCYDYAGQRESWMCQLVTSWMGDDGWLWKYFDEMRRFLYIGDTAWVKGKVTKKYVTKGNKSVVDLDVWVEDQRGRNTAPGNFSVILPSRERGPVQIPVLPEEDSMKP